MYISLLDLQVMNRYSRRRDTSQKLGGGRAIRQLF